MSRQFTLGRDERLKSRKQTEKLFSEGKKFSAGFFRIHFLENKSDSPGLIFGVGVSKRSFKKAVERNRVKRLIREAYRLQKLPLQQKLVDDKKQVAVFFIYTGKIMPTYKDIFSNMVAALEKLTRLINNNP